jgi:ABC-type phosphate transport system substrate-binding protein
MRLNPISESIPGCALFLTMALILGGAAQAGDFVVIVNKANSAAVDKTTVAKIYTGEVKSWSDGTSVMAFDLPEDNPQRASFDTDVVGKSTSSLKALWAQLTFSGKALPPRSAPSDDEVKKLVAANKGAVGYIKPGSVDDSVKVAVK